MVWRSVFSRLTLFQKTALITAAVTFLLIFIGGLVRATGAGLGCPDWPRCFGLWIPPMSAAELPEAYDPEQFNVFKTWMEYVNRLVGVLVGFLILLTFAFSTRYVRRDPGLFYGALAAFVLVLFQGWLGGQVVRSGLTSWIISIHMIIALLILNVLLWTFYHSVRERLRFSLQASLKFRLTALISLLLGATLIQIILGSQVREAIEAVKVASPWLERGEWLAQTGLIDTIHRSFSWLVLILVFVLLQRTRSNQTGPYLPLVVTLITISTLLQILAGIVLAYLSLPPVFQVLHLWLAAFMISAQFFALFLIIHAQREITQ